MQVSVAATAQVPNACSLLSPVEIQKITGRNDLATGKPDLNQLKAGTECLHTGKHDIGVHLRPITSDLFAQIRDAGKKSPNYKYEPASVGDEAYTMIDKRYVVLTSRVGQHSFHVAMDLEGAPPDSIKPMVLALAKAAAAKLR
jgi:hypothetical protein